MIPSTDKDVDDVTLNEMLTAAHRGQVDYCVPGGMSVSQSSSSVMFDGSGQPDGERMVDGSGKPDERDSSNAQIRTLLEEQRQTIIAEYREKVSHHELQAAQAEQDRKVLQEELLRQQQDFREVHQQDLMKHQELQKFQNSAFDEFTQKKFIEDQKTVMELYGRLQELQNEVNFMNDSKDFMDAESICSGNPHVTSPPGLFPRHPPFVGMLKPAFISQRQDEEPPNIRDTSGTSGNVFAHPQASSSAPYPQELNSTWKKTTEEPIHMSIAEKSGRPERDSDLRCQSGPSAYDVSTSLTGYEPNFVAFSELNDSSGSFSYITPSSDQDMDDVTLGKLLTEAHRGQADYCEPEGMSVSQSSSVVFHGSGQPDGERNVDQSVNFGVTRNTYSAHSKFSENTRTEKMVDGSGKPDERDSSNAQIRTLLEEQRQMIIAEYREEVGHHELQAAHAEEERYKDNYGNRNWNFVKLINEVSQRWKNYENFRVPPSILLREESSSRT